MTRFECNRFVDVYAYKANTDFNANNHSTVKRATQTFSQPRKMQKSHFLHDNVKYENIVNQEIYDLYLQGWD